MKYQRSERGTLEIRTQEGDIVQLKFRTRESFKAEAGPNDDDSGTVLTLSARASSKLSVRVRGDLNAEELAAIQDTVESAIDIAGDFFEGDVQAGFESASALNMDSTQLARVHFKLQMKERLTYSVRGFDASTRNRQPAEPTSGTPENNRSRVEARATDTAPTDVTPLRLLAQNGPNESSEAEKDERSEADHHRNDDSVKSRTGDVARAERMNALKAVGGFLGRLIDTVDARARGDESGPLDLSLKIRIVQSTLLAMTATATGQASVPELVPETLDALATQHAAPLERVG